MRYDLDDKQGSHVCTVECSAEWPDLIIHQGRYFARIAKTPAFARLLHAHNTLYQEGTYREVIAVLVE